MVCSEREGPAMLCHSGVIPVQIPFSTLVSRSWSRWDCHTCFNSCYFRPLIRKRITLSWHMEGTNTMQAVQISGSTVWSQSLQVSSCQTCSESSCTEDGVSALIMRDTWSKWCCRVSGKAWGVVSVWNVSVWFLYHNGLKPLSHTSCSWRISLEMAGVSETTRKKCSVAKTTAFQSFSRWKRVSLCNKPVC